MRMKDAGWVWEGQGFDPGVEPSIFGVGEGAAFFGIRRACFMFHLNTPFAMRKLAYLEEVVCDISKWKYRWLEEGGVGHRVDASAESVRAEARLVSQLSRDFPNITGAIHDDMLGLVKNEGYGPEEYAPIYEALRSENPALKLWTVVYTHELERPEWKAFAPYMDIVNLWIWEAKNLPHLDEYMERCRAVFPGKPINLGCYLRDYPTVAPVPMDLLKCQWERIPRYLGEGLIQGYSILGTVLIDGQQEQAEWVRDFIAAH
ncbi:MAG: hypothetical protein IT210_01960 [Armatimonadetes bacterium]|nr:hypothetical protein [Armatimonadota bacterium]